MKVLMQAKGGLGKYFVEFKPIHDEWYSWKTGEGELKILHEKCYFRIISKPNEMLSFMKETDQAVCAFCGVEAPNSVKQFILLANGVRGYEAK